MKSKFVLAQLEQKGLPEENLENAKKAVAEAMELYKPDLMVFPECFMSHFPMGTDRATCLGTAQTPDGPFVTGMKALAKDNGIWIIFGPLTIRHIFVTRLATKSPMIINREITSLSRSILRSEKLVSSSATKSVSRKLRVISVPRELILSSCRQHGYRDR